MSQDLFAPVLVAGQEIVTLFKKHPWAPTVKELAYWSDPLYSAEMFAALNLGFYLLTFGEYSVLTLTSQVFILLILISFAYTRYAAFRQADTTTYENVLHSVVQSFSEDNVKEHVTFVFEFVGIVRQLMVSSLQSSNLATALVVAVFFILAQLGKLFSGFGYLWIATLITFSAPKIYQEKQTEIDKVLLQITNVVKEQVKGVQKKLKSE